jgi:hypothetical protein
VSSQSPVVWLLHEVHCLALWVCTEASNVLRAVAADFRFNWWCLEIPSDNSILHVTKMQPLSCARLSVRNVLGFLCWKWKPYPRVLLRWTWMFKGGTPWRHMGRGGGYIDLGSSWRWVVGFTPLLPYSKWNSSRNPFDTRLGGSQGRSGGNGETKILDSTGTRNPTIESSSP